MGRCKQVVGHLALGAATAWAPVSSAAAQAPIHAHWAPTAVERAETHLAAEEFGPAGDAFDEYYRTLPPSMQTDATGEFIVMKAADAYARAWDATQDLEQLQRSRGLLQRYVQAVETAHGADTPLRVQAAAELSRIEALIADATAPEPEPEPETAPVRDPVTVEPEPDSAHQDPDPQPDPDRDEARGETSPSTADQPRDRLGLGLVAGGSALAMGGVTMALVGVLRHNGYETIIDDGGGFDALAANQRTAAADTRELLDTQRTGLLAAGISVAALGVGGIVWGALRLTRARRDRQAARWHLAPQIAGSQFGLIARGRF